MENFRNNKYSRIFIISGVYITAVVGAGFASGKEIVSYFVKYGNISILGAAAASILFAVVLYALLVAGKYGRYDSFFRYFEDISGKRVGKIFGVVSGIFMLCVFAAMLACMGDLLGHIGIKGKYGVLAASLFCFVCLLFDLKGISCVNAFMSPFIVFGMMFVCLYVFFFRESSVFMHTAELLTDNFAASALEYTGYNMLTAAVVVLPMGRMIEDKKEAKYAGILSGICLFVMMVMMWCVIKIYYGKIQLGDIPMLTIVMREGGGIFLIYMAVLGMAVVTTAVSAGYGIMCEIKGIGIGRKTAVLAVCAAGYAAAGIGFGNIVEYVYRMCGIAGEIMIALIIYDFIKRKREISNKK